MEMLSPREKKAYDYIRKAVAEQGYSPSIRDIQNALGIKSTSTVHSLLGRLEDAGYISRKEGKSRAIRLCDSEAGSSRCRIPVLGNIRNSSPLDTDRNFSGYIDFAIPDGLCANELFAYRIAGNGVERLGILDGDYIIVKKSDAAEIGDIVCVAVDGRLETIPYKKLDSDTVLLGKLIASVKYF